MLNKNDDHEHVFSCLVFSESQSYSGTSKKLVWGSIIVLEKKNHFNLGNQKGKHLGLINKGIGNLLSVDIKIPRLNG